MSTRKLFAALFAAAALTLSQIAFAVAADEVIDPSRPAGDDGKEKTSAAMQGLFSGESASNGALITLLGYAVIIGAIAVIVWFFFKGGVLRKPFAKGEGKLKIAETRMLGNRQFISVVEYEDQKILIGVGPGKIDYLTTLRSDSSGFPQMDSSLGQSGLGGGE